MSLGAFDHPRRLGLPYLQWEACAVRNTSPIKDQVVEPIDQYRMALYLHFAPPD